eukprot:gene21926-28972_t
MEETPAFQLGAGRKAQAQVPTQPQLAADPDCIAWIQEKLELLFPAEGSDGRKGLEDASEWLQSIWDPEVHTNVLSSFLMLPKSMRMFAILDDSTPDKVSISLMLDVPKVVDHVMYFVRDPTQFVTKENVRDTVNYGMVQGGDALHSLLRIMHGLYVPLVVGNASWPETVKNDFTAQMHKFMANLTETVYEVKGKTILYIPQEELSDTKLAAKQKDLVQRLESTIIHWTRQIKELVSKQDSVDASEHSGPLDEIDFWRERSVDLSGIRAQLDDPNVAQIVAVLENAKSSYLAPFLNLRNLIHREAVAAEDNLKFLLCLEEPCQALAKAHPEQIPDLLPPILNCIRMVWNISRFYNTPERVTVMLRKLSNEIIVRCCAVIDLPNIFSGEVDGVMQALRQSIEAGEKWKELYNQTAKAITARSPEPWDFDVSSIFAHIDAFLQRCIDLLEVCEAQLQFAPRNPLPVFGGTKAPEVRKSILDIQESFKKLVVHLKGVTYNILDVKATRWHDDFNSFKSGIKDLEVMLTNVIQLACECQSSLIGRVELLEAFEIMAKRDFIKRFVEKKTSEFYNHFNSEVNIVKKQFDTLRRSPPKSPILPKYAGAARYALNLLRRLQATHTIVSSVRYMLPEVPEVEEVFAAYDLAQASIEQYMHNTHNDWFSTIEANISRELQANLMTVDKSAGGLISMNFHKDLLSMSQEVHYWERMRMSIPYIAMEINAQREKYRVMRDNDLMVVRDYNKILTVLDKEERRLFHDRIRHLDRRIMPGVSKLTWVHDKHDLEFYFKEARKYCRDADVYVADFKAANMRIDAICKAISELTLVSVEKKKIYQHSEFYEMQAAHHSQIEGKLVRSVEEIKEVMSVIYRVFESDSEEVQREWVKFTQRVDKKMEEALRYTVKKSLQEMSRLLNGDNKTEVTPIFHVTMCLERNNRVEMQPTIQSMFDMVHKQVPRLAQQLTDKQRRDLEDANMALPKPLPSLYEIISSDEEAVLKTIMQITSGITSIVDKVQGFLTYWEKKYKHIWEVDKDAYMRRYEKAQKPLSSFDADIQRYNQLQDDVLIEESTTNMRFLRIDCGPLKQTLISHCENWNSKFTGLLNSLANTELLSLHNYFETCSEQLSRVPVNLDQLAELVNLQRKLVDEKAQVQARFEPLREKYKVLDKFEVQVPEEQLNLLDELDSARNKNQAVVEDTGAKLDKYKENFREKVKSLLDSFLKDISVMGEEFFANAPYTHEKVTYVEALEYVEQYKQGVLDHRKRGADLKAGMDIFNIPSPSYKDVQAIEKDLDFLEKIWGYVKEWQGLYSTWKDGAFAEIKIEEMEEAAIRIGKNVVKLGRDIKQWPVWSWIKDIIDAFKRTMPLITDLRNPSMRERHWEQLMTEIGTKFDPFSPTFSLDSVVQLRLDQHAEFIAELSVNSMKELAMENNIKTIAEAWNSLDLDLTEYKQTYKLRSTEDVFVALEENTVMLSTMKASKFFVTFEKDIVFWEKTLSHISEAIEIIQAVQRNWMYLENIFIGSEDIRKQLPQESILFEGINSNFLRVMKQLHSVGNCLKATTAPGVLENLQGINKETKQLHSVGNCLKATTAPGVLENLQESILFEGINSNFLRVMKQLHSVGNCLKASTAPGVLANLQESILFEGINKVMKQLHSVGNCLKATTAPGVLKNLQELILFEGINKVMKQLHSVGNCLKATTAPGVLENLQDMDAKLEKIQKSLENYLENKRQQFPRFYFLSSDDLLEILGQAKDPVNVQSHLKKCFEGIKKLDMHPPNEDRKQYCSVGIYSPDGEYLPFNGNVITEGRPEEWLNRVEDAMFATTKKHLYKVLEDSKATKKEKWVKDNQGQMIITAGQIVWTHECEKALGDAESARRNVKLLKKKWISYLSKLTTVTRSKLNKVERNKVVSLITIEVHARDVIEKLARCNCSSTNDFEWVSQLRFYWDKDLNDCVVKQVLSIFVYGYEYQGNNGRLVMTPLTDRCYMTLGAAMFTRRGGNLLGSASTGKAETESDFGKVVSEYVVKIIQVFDCKVARHGNMIVGKTGSGKSEAWKCLQRSLARLKKEDPEDERFQKVHVHTINPLALSNDELYGCFEESTHEWQDGILARIMRTVCKDESLDQKWILFDGPVDTLWIESMNTTLDDNKLLTLLSGERISMTPQVSLLFEVEDLSQASPATVSRAGMIYLNVEDLGWRPFMTSWMALKKDPIMIDVLNKLIDKYLEVVLEHKRLHCKELVPMDRLSCVRSFTRLFDAFALPENGVTKDEGEHYPLLIEMWFQFCMIWGIGGTLDEDGRKKFDALLREMDTRYPTTDTVFEYFVDHKTRARYPTTDTVFEYFVDHKTRAWSSWETKLSSAYKPSPELPFFKIMVPTVDTVRNKFVASALVRVFQHTLIVGNVGVGKTMIVNSLLESLGSDRSAMTINFSAQTSSNSLQDTIEGKLEKRTKGVFAPAGGKKLVTFIDDLNMPQKSVFGFLPPLELLKLWIDNGFWYDRNKCEVKVIKDMQLIASMAPPGGGRNAFSQRVSACFATINVTSPNDAQLKRIFGTILNAKLAEFDDEVKPLADPITSATIAIYRSVSKELLPTPSKSHYLFNTRDLAKIIQGMMQARHLNLNLGSVRLLATRSKSHYLFSSRDLAKIIQGMASKTYYNSKDEMLQLWCHETARIIADRMWDASDKKWLEKQLDEKLGGLFSTSFGTLFEPFGGSVPPFVTFMRQMESPPYEPVRDVVALKELLMEKLEDYALEPGNSAMDLVLFRDALHHICRIHRILDQPRGNALLVGVGGSGRKSLSRLATYVAELKCFTIEIAKNYRSVEFHEDLKGLYKQAGCNNKPTVFLFDETQIVSETFLEDVNNILTSGEVPNLFPKDEIGPVLDEVASKQLQNETFESEDVKTNICKVFVTAHQSVEVTSKKMLAALKRQTYVTPTNYLETVRGYRNMLSEKRAELGDKAAKLKGGLQKLGETTIQDKKVVVAQAKTDCEELLVEIVQDKRVADEQEKQVNAEATKIGKEAEEANAIATQVQSELDKALPALQAAEDALNVLTKKDMSELKAYAKPPALVELTLSAVMTVLRRPPNWEEAKKALGDASFMQKLLDFDKDKLDDGLLKKITKGYGSNPDFTAEAVGKVSGAATGLVLLVRAMETYGYVAKEVGPKRAKLKAAQDNLAKKQAALKLAQEQLAVVLAKVQALKDKYDGSISKKKALEDELSDLEGKLERAEKLVTGLAGERVRWEASIDDLELRLGFLPGDVVVASAFMSYAGPFPSEYRDELVNQTWLPQVKALHIPASEHFDFALFLADPKNVRDWNIQGLPSDSFSTENGVMVTRGSRWPLMIDPQGQANKWIKSMEGKGGQLKVLNLQMHDLARQMENAIQFGWPVLLQDIMEEIDPVLEPVLSKSFIKRGAQTLIKLGDKEVDYNFDFKLYITTKLANPHYTPEISTKAAIVNFSVKEQGLEAQLLNIVVKNERPDLDKQKNDLVVKVAAGKRTQADLEDQILFLLSTSTGSLLDNIELIDTLDSSKTTWEEVNVSLKIAEETGVKIEAASQLYRPCSVRASILYFVLNDLSQVDPMYQFSLDAYNDLFLMSIRNSPKTDNLTERIKNLNDYHTYAVYKYTSRGLFERHKLLLSLQMCMRILQTANQVNMEEWQFFLKGGSVLDRSAQVENPAPTWISEEAWDNVTELEHLPNYKGVVNSFEQNIGEWERWYRQNEPETAELPSEWESKCNELQRMILVRCLRPDRVIFSASSYASNSLGRKFVEPPVLDLSETYVDSTPAAPLIFVLSSGVDPTDNLRKLAVERNMSSKFHTVALGQGQSPVATRLIEDGLREGHWVFLANCHLMTSWLPTLDKLIESFESKNPHENFRLWLSSSPSQDFPIAILQRGIKMTTEPPKESYAQCKTQLKYQKLLFSLTYFHSVLLERRKFRTLGLNIPYDFNDTDFSVSDDLLKSYLDSYENTPWDALKYLIAEANYGGRVTDELDRRVLNSYLNKFYCEDALAVPNYMLSPLPHYYIPENGTLQSFREYIITLPQTDRPEAFGQHANAEISYLIADSKVLLDSLLALQPRTGGAGAGARPEDVVMAIATDLLEQVPLPFNLENVMKSKADDPSALHVVLFQEVERYNSLLVSVRHSCAELLKGIKGLVVMSSDLDQIFDALFVSKVPPAWLKCFPSLKPLGSWTRDVLQRIDQLAKWIEVGYPLVYWLSGFTYPTGFLTAVLQTTARKNAVPIDTLSFEYSIVNLDEKEILQAPKEGVYVKGLFLEGAGWDFENGCLCEPEPMELIVPMPLMLFKPVENKKKSQKGTYFCPLYFYPVRTGSRERPSFMISVDLRSGSKDAEHYVMRGTALMLSLAT